MQLLFVHRPAEIGRGTLNPTICLFCALLRSELRQGSGPRPGGSLSRREKKMTDGGGAEQPCDRCGNAVESGRWNVCRACATAEELAEAAS